MKVLIFLLPFSNPQANCSVENRHLHTDDLQSLQSERKFIFDCQLNASKIIPKKTYFAIANLQSWSIVLIISEIVLFVEECVILIIVR